MTQLIDVPAGLKGVAVTETEIGDVRGAEGFYHYRQYDATELARTFAGLKPGVPLPTNVEFSAALVLEAVGLPQELFTSTFAVSRVVGWTAHVMEQAARNKIIRPSARYTGPSPVINMD